MQFIIDRVREARLELGLSQRDVSRFINMHSDTNIIGKIESPFRNASYTDHNLNLIAAGFSKHAVEISHRRKAVPPTPDFKIVYSVLDFYPKVPLDDVPQLKNRIDIPKNAGPSATINAILESKDFLDKARSIREITEYSNSLVNQNWKSNNLTSTLDYAVRKGKLKKIELPDGGVLYQRP